jgi:hypothetical protein
MVEKTPTHWLWTGSYGSHAYGHIYGGPDSGAPLLAHVVAWELENGPVPDGLEIDHTCRVRSCIRPSHMEAVPHGVNVTRGARAMRAECVRGHSLAIGDPNTGIRKNGHRYCRECLRIRTWNRRHPGEPLPPA